MKFTSHSLSETQNIAKDFLNSLPESSESALLIGLRGDLGSGKTTFTQQVAKLLDIQDQISSPTFVIEKIYQIPESSGLKFKKLIHFDCYRLEKGEELLRLGFEEILKDSDNLILMEWPERVEEVLLKNYNVLNFEFIDENTRLIEILWLNQEKN